MLAPAQRYLFIATIALINANSILAATLYLPSYPAIARALEVPLSALPLTLSLYFLAFSIGQLITGPLSDRFGRRWLLLGGIAILTLSSLLCALAQSFDALLLGRIAQGFGAGAGMVIIRTMVNDLFAGREAARIASMITASLALVPIMAPTIGGVLEHFLGWTAGFWFTAGSSMLVLVVIYLRVPETHQPPEATGPLLLGFLQSYRRLLGSRAFLGFALVNVGIMAGMQGFAAGAPAVIIDYMGVDPVRFGLLISLTAAGFMVGSVTSSFGGARLGQGGMISAGLCFIGVGAALIFLATEMFPGEMTPLLVGILAGRLIWTIGMGMALPNSVNGAIGVNRAALGAGAALTGFMQTVGGGLGAAANALFPAGDPVYFGLAFGGTAAFTVLAWLICRKASLRTLT